MRVVAIFILFITFSESIFSQQYFQQRVNINITVNLNTQHHTLNGYEEIVYFNNSPDTLDFLFIHLWPNAYNGSRTALMRQMLENGSSKLFFADEKKRGYIDSLRFQSNNTVLNYTFFENNPDIIRLELDKPLLPGDSVVITTPFFVKIPSAEFSRLGYEGSDYMITQWYPKPAVYDLQGWHPMPYLDQGEFYSNFGTYKVSITLPKNYVAGATGVLQNEDERRFLEQQSQISIDEWKPGSDSVSVKTLTYVAENVIDFAWFASPRRIVRKSIAELPSGKKVECWAYFSPDSKETWRNSADYVKSAVLFYSDCLGEYPYPQASAFEGTVGAGGGMEYPMITVVSVDESPEAVEEVIVHEVGHNWLQGIIATNERQYPWMDEAINTYYDNRYLKEKKERNRRYPNISENVSITDYAALMSIYPSRNNVAQPLGISSEKFGMLNYGLQVYMQGALYFRHIQQYLGKPAFDKAMRRYYEEWKFRHPTPDDLKLILEKESGKNFEWFFNDVLNTTTYADYRIQKLKTSKNELRITIKNKGKQRLPLYISVINKNGSDTGFWADGFRGKKTLIFKNVTAPQSVVINPASATPELYRNNNFYTVGSLFPRTNIKLTPLISSEAKPADYLYWFPALGFNAYDGFMTGVMLYNHLLPRKAEFEFVPLYGFNSKNLVGLFRFNRYFNFSEPFFIRTVSLGFSAKTLNYLEYNNKTYRSIKFAPELKFLFRNDLRSNILQQLRYRFIYTARRVPEPNPDVYYIRADVVEKNYNELTYSFERNLSVNPYSIIATVLHNPSFVKAGLEGKYEITLSPKKSIDLRFFGGGFLWQQSGYYGNYNFRMSSWNGSQDYLFDYYFAGRSESQGLWSQQTVETEGGFKVPTYVGNTNQWLFALNLKSHLPGKLPLRVFADFGTYHRAGTLFEGSQKVMYDAGIMLSVWKDHIEVYVPLWVSDDIKKVAELNNIRFEQQIRFMLRLEKLDVFTLIRQLPWMNLGSLF